MRSAVVLGIVLVSGCLGERGAVPRAAPKAAVVAAPKAAAAGTCEATADRLVALSVVADGQAGRPWSTEKQDTMRREYAERCVKESAEGKFDRRTLACVERAPTLDVARACLLAASR